MTALGFVVLVALAATYDSLAVAWHSSRERGHAWRTGAIAAVMEIVGAVPLAVVFTEGTLWPLLAGVIGSVLGTVWGVARASTNRRP